MKTFEQLCFDNGVSEDCPASIEAHIIAKSWAHESSVGELFSRIIGLLEKERTQ